jgi:hypothetical protein
MDPVDELFGGAPPPAGPPDDAALVRAGRFLSVGVVLTLLGPCCFTGVPGAGLCLWAWMLCDEQVQGVERGALPAALGTRARAAERRAWWASFMALVFCVGQVVAFWLGVYGAVFEGVGGLL